MIHRLDPPAKADGRPETQKRQYPAVFRAVLMLGYVLLRKSYGWRYHFLEFLCQSGNEYGIGGPGNRSIRSGGKILLPCGIVPFFPGAVDGGPDGMLHIYLEQPFRLAMAG